jgi:hypothetical protein
MKKLSLLLLLCMVTVALSPAAFAQNKRTLTGNSGKSIEAYGIKQEVYGTWMGRGSWKDIADANWMMLEESGTPKWKREHFDRPMDVGVPLIPTDSKTASYDDMLKEAISGAQDSTYISLGRNLAKYGSKTVYARLWWEFNMYPIKQDVKLFIAAWQTAVPLIRKGFDSAAVNGQKLSIVWCINAGPPNPEPFYPGDDVVDVVGSDTYGMTWGDTDPTVEQMLHRITKEPYMLEWHALFANLHKKPTCLGEWANVAPKGNKVQDIHGVGDCPGYIDIIYNWTKTCKYSCLYVCYFNIPDGGILTTLDDLPKSVARLKARAAKGGLD